MATLIEQLDSQQRLRGRGRFAFIGGALTAVGFWLTAPFGVVLLLERNTAGWILVAVGAVLAAASVFLFGRARKVASAIVVLTKQGKANPHFDEPDAPPAHPGMQMIGWGPGGGA